MSRRRQSLQRNRRAHFVTQLGGGAGKFIPPQGNIWFELDLLWTFDSRQAMSRRSSAAKGRELEKSPHVSDRLGTRQALMTS